MLITPSSETKVYINLSPIDMRKSINSLSAIIFELFEKNPTSGDLFVFYNRKKDKLKLLHWDRNGFGLYYKRLEQGKFQFSTSVDGRVEISHEQLSWLLAGLDFTLMAKFPELNYSAFY